MNIKKIFKKNEINKILYFMKKDKKNVDEKINLILLKIIGKTTDPKKISMHANQIKSFLKLYF